jgi:hypothetical protein
MVKLPRLEKSQFPRTIFDSLGIYAIYTRGYLLYISDFCYSLAYSWYIQDTFVCVSMEISIGSTCFHIANTCFQSHSQYMYRWRHQVIGLLPVRAFADNGGVSRLTTFQLSAILPCFDIPSGLVAQTKEKYIFTSDSSGLKSI